MGRGDTEVEGCTGDGLRLGLSAEGGGGRQAAGLSLPDNV